MLKPKKINILLFFLLQLLFAHSISAQNCPELADPVEFCVSKSAECLANVQNPNEVAICNTGFSKCAISTLELPRIRTKPLSKNCSIFIAETEKAVKRASEVRFQELVEETISWIKNAVSPIISNLVKSKKPLLEFNNLHKSPEDLITFLIRNSQVPLTKRTSKLIEQVEKSVSSQVLDTPFDTWMGGFGGALGKCYDRLWVAVFCRNSENKINQVSAKHSDCSNGKVDKQLCDNQLITDLMNIADTSTDKETCKMYALSVEASLKLVPKKSYGLRPTPLTEKDTVMDQITGRSYQYNQDGLLKLPEGQEQIYENCAYWKRQISACQDAKNHCARDPNTKDEDCELSFDNCHYQIEPDDGECLYSLGQTVPQRFMKLFWKVYEWVVEIRDWLATIFMAYQIYQIIQEQRQSGNRQQPRPAQEVVPEDQQAEPVDNNLHEIPVIQLEPPRESNNIVAESIEMQVFKPKGGSSEDQGRGLSDPEQPAEVPEGPIPEHMEPDQDPEASGTSANNQPETSGSIPIDPNNYNEFPFIDDEGNGQDSGYAESTLLPASEAEEAGTSRAHAEVLGDPNDASTPLLWHPLQ